MDSSLEQAFNQWHAQLVARIEGCLRFIDTDDALPTVDVCRLRAKLSEVLCHVANCPTVTDKLQGEVKQ
jgi:hypothetical protein